MNRLSSNGALVALVLVIPALLTPLSVRAEGEFGYVLREYPRGYIWWAEGSYKVFRETPVPPSPPREPEASAPMQPVVPAKDKPVPKPAEPPTPPIKIAAARNEYEPFQLVFRPKRTGGELKVVEVTDFKDSAGNVIPAKNVEINVVEYVNVEKPTDALGHVGLYPDPLPPWHGYPAHEGLTAERPGLLLEPGQNQPIWFTVYVPPKTPAGLYRGGINMTIDQTRLQEFPVELEVYDFTLPKETHTETAYGVHLNADYHGLKSEEDREKTFDLYMQNCAKHRISPYSPMEFHPIKCRVNPTAPNPEDRIQLDFSDFDKAAHKYLDEFAFTAFNFASIVSGFDVSPRWSTPEEKELKTQVIRKVCEHLAEKGWLNKAYDYWIDEPPREKYGEVLESMMFLKEADQRLRRLLTFCHDKAPLPFFYGGVDLWVPVLSLFEPERAKQRQGVGEWVWWYVCCGPHHPYPNNFIDHPAINHRIRFWMIQKYGTNGSLYWSVTYWAQNPWKTAMSYSPEGGTWGNGDGRLLYPPAKEKPETPMVCPPINSIRFEMLREGLEDREYFWLLSQAIEALKKKGGASLADAIAEGEKAIGIVDTLVRSLTDYEKDPQKLYAARTQIARTIVKLEKLLR